MKTLIIFDLDETLVGGDTSVIWRQFLQDKGVITDPNFNAKDNEMMRQYAEGTLNLAEYIAFTLAPLSGIAVEQVNQWVASCVSERIMPNIYPKAKALLQTLNKDTDQEIMIISATVSFIVAQVAEALGVKQAIGVDLAVKNGAYSQEIVGIPSFREGKVSRLKQWLTEQGKTADYDKITFYTDSINDLPLCEYADEVFTVNPCPLLAPIAEKRGWQKLNWTL